MGRPKCICAGSAGLPSLAKSGRLPSEWGRPLGAGPPEGVVCQTALQMLGVGLRALMLREEAKLIALFLKNTHNATAISRWHAVVDFRTASSRSQKPTTSASKFPRFFEAWLLPSLHSRGWVRITSIDLATNGGLRLKVITTLGLNGLISMIWRR